MILCSECYDKLGIDHFTNIQCQATCERCKRICLGYVTVEQAPPRRKKDKMDTKELTLEQVESANELMAKLMGVDYASEKMTKKQISEMRMALEIYTEIASRFGDGDEAKYVDLGLRAFVAMRAFWKVAAHDLAKQTKQKGTSDDSSGGA